MEAATFNQLRLAGGTSLALQLGHRQSIDIDLFGKLEADDISISNTLAEIGNYKLLNKTDNIKIFLVNDIKVDIVNYPYSWLEKPVFDGNLRLAVKSDIAAMKLAAVAGRGTKKDFIDIYFLLKEFSLAEMLVFYNKKFPEASEFLVLKSLTWFKDADDDEFPRMIVNEDWNFMKQKITNSVREIINQ